MSQLGQVITWVFIGLIAGMFAGRIAWGRHFSTGMAIVIGIIGGIVGGLLFGFLHIQFPPALSVSISIALPDVIAAFIGAVIVLLLIGFFDRRRR